MVNNAAMTVKTKSQSKSTIQSIVDVFKNVAGYAPAVATMVGSALIAYDGFAYGRPDVAAGGIALFALGMELFGLGRHENRVLGLFNAKALGKVFQPGDRMAVLGLGACAALGGGEIVHMIARHGITAENLMSSEIWKSLLDDPAIYKVAANLTLYPLASVMDLHKVEQFAKEHKMERAHRILQTGLLIGGAVMIARFGELGKIFSARMFGRLNSAAGFVRLGQLAATEEEKPDQMQDELIIEDAGNAYVEPGYDVGLMGTGKNMMVQIEEVPAVNTEIKSSAIDSPKI